MACVVAPGARDCFADSTSASLQCFVGSTRPPNDNSSQRPSSTTKANGTSFFTNPQPESPTSENASSSDDDDRSLFASTGQPSPRSRDNQSTGLLNLVNAIEEVNKKPSSSVKLETISPLPSSRPIVHTHAQPVQGKNVGRSVRRVPGVKTEHVQISSGPNMSNLSNVPRSEISSSPAAPFNTNTQSASVPAQASNNGQSCPQLGFQVATAATTLRRSPGNPVIPFPLPLPFPALAPQNVHPSNPSIVLTSTRRKSAFRPGKRLTRLQTRLTSDPAPQLTLSPNATALVNSHRAQTQQQINGADSPTSSTHSDSSPSTLARSIDLPMASSRPRRDSKTLGGLSLPLLQVAEIEHRATIAEGGGGGNFSPGDHYDSSSDFRRTSHSPWHAPRVLMARSPPPSGERRSSRSALHGRRPRSAWRRIGHKRSYLEHRAAEAKIALANKRRRRAKPKISPATGMVFQPCRGRPRGRHSFSFSSAAKTIMIRVYALGIVSPSKSQLLAMVDIIRAEELHQRSNALMNGSQSPQEHHEAGPGSDSSGSPSPLKAEPESSSSSDSSDPPSPRSNSSGNQSSPESEDTTMQDDTKEEENDIRPIPSPLSPPRQTDIDSPLHQLQQCNSTNVRSFLTNFRSCPPPLSHMNFSQSEPGQWPNTGTFFPLLSRSQSQSHDVGHLSSAGGVGRSARRQLDLSGASFGGSEQYAFMDSEQVGNPHLREHSMSRISQVTVADHVKAQSDSGLKTEDVADDTLMKSDDYTRAHSASSGSFLPQQQDSPSSGSTSASATSAEAEDETELAINEHAKVLLNLQALDDSVQAICDLDAPSKRRVRVRSAEPDSAHHHDMAEAKENEIEAVVESEQPMPLMIMEEDAMEGVTVERIRNWFKNRRYSAKKTKDKGRRKNC